MTRRSIRVRLTAWYVAVVALAVLAVAGGAWWLAQRSLHGAVDESLRRRALGVADFIAAVERELPREEVLDEFKEFAALSLGESFLEVIDPAGVELCRPSIAGWAELSAGAAAPGIPGEVVFTSYRLNTQLFRVGSAKIDVNGHQFRMVAAVPMGQVEDALGRLGWLIVICVPPVVLAAAAGGYWISGRALAPVDRMTRAAQAINVRHLDRRLEVPAADDELRRLAVTFNDMLSRLQASVAEMTQLVAEASHELRTPVSLVRATAEVALARDRPAEEYRQALVETQEHAERLSRLVNDLLILARADAGVEVRDAAPVDLREAIRDAVRDVQAAAARQRLALVVDVGREPLVVSADAESVRRLLLILLGNAMAYTPSGGTVTVAARLGDAVIVEVVDTGSGIDPADLPRVFDRFYRGATARQLAPDGSGLGLSIARTIVERCGGTISVGPGPGGTGCRVEVKVPVHSVRLTR